MDFTDTEIGKFCVMIPDLVFSLEQCFCGPLDSCCPTANENMFYVSQKHCSAERIVPDGTTV